MYMSKVGITNFNELYDEVSKYITNEFELNLIKFC